MKRILGFAAGLLVTTSLAHAETVLLSMKGPGAGNPFWAAVEQGAKDKAAELGVDLVVLAPPQETDVQTQISQVEDQLAKGIDGLALAPTDQNALAPIVEQAKEQGVGVVFVDTMGSNEGVTFIGTDNKAGGRLAADHICANVEKGSDVVIIHGVITQSSHQGRVAGAVEGFEACGAKIAAQQPADSDRALGQSVMENILTGNPNLKAVFATNDNMALGAVEALKSAGKLADVMVIGFDANPDAIASIQAGEMTASVAQSPANMGAFGVEYALKVKRGETVEANVDTGTALVTKENAAEYQ